MKSTKQDAAGSRNNKIAHADAINAFVVKLKLWNQRTNNRNFASFHRLNDIAGEITLYNQLPTKIAK